MPSARNLDQAAVVALLLDGHTLTAVARQLGCHLSSIQWIASRHAGRHPALASKPRPPRVYREPVRVMPRFVRVPAEYRAAGLTEDYRDLVRDFGDAEGERRCRRLLDETRAIAALTGANPRKGGAA